MQPLLVNNWQDSTHAAGELLANPLETPELSPKVPRALVDAHQLLGRVVRECHNRIGSKGLHVSLRLLSHQYYVNDDGERLRQVYTNLLNNAVAAARPGSKITLRASCPSDCALRIEVEERSPWRAKLQSGDTVAVIKKKAAIPKRGRRS
jgi:signal transduction histidine kinase